MLLRETKTQVVIMTNDLYAHVAKDRRVVTLNPEAVKAIAEMHNALNSDGILESKEDTIARLSANLTEISGKYRDLNCKLSLKESDNHDLIEKKKELEAKLQDMIENGKGKEYHDLSISYKSLMTKYEDIMTENEKLKAAHARDTLDITSTIDELKKANGNLMTALEESQETTEGLLKNKAHIVELLNKVKAENSKLQNDIVNRDSHIVDLNNTIINKDYVISNKEKDLANAKETCKTLGADNKCYRAERDKANEELKKLKEVHNATNDELASRDRIIDKLQQSLSVKQAAIDAMIEGVVGAFNNRPIEISNNGTTINSGNELIYSGSVKRITRIAKLIREGRISITAVQMFQDTKRD